MFKDKLIQATFWSNLFYSIGYPYIHVVTMRAINESMISANTLVICICTIAINSMWNRKSHVLYRLLPMLMALESIAYLIISTLLAFSDTFSPLWYYILDTILFSLVSRNIICGANKLKALVYTGDDREKYDNTVQIASCISTIIGSIFILLIDVPTQIAIMLSWAGITIDNILYFLEYRDHSSMQIIEKKGGNC